MTSELLKPSQDTKPETRVDSQPTNLFNSESIDDVDSQKRSTKIELFGRSTFDSHDPMRALRGGAQMATAFPSKFNSTFQSDNMASGVSFAYRNVDFIRIPEPHSVFSCQYEEDGIATPTKYRLPKL